MKYFLIKSIKIWTAKQNKQIQEKVDKQIDRWNRAQQSKQQHHDKIKTKILQERIKKKEINLFSTMKTQLKKSEINSRMKKSEMHSKLKKRRIF